MDYEKAEQDLRKSGETGEQKRPSKFSKLTQNAGTVVNTTTIDAATHVLDSISEVGAAVPFVAPAFVLLKVLIDTEKRAQDADSKCADLFQRIVFMLSHLPMLAQIEIMPATTKVISRIHEALKDSVSLIVTYRKQGPVARRLTVSNRDKFVKCAETINTCCQDLLTSLQIHQTIKMDVLNQKVPEDVTDQAAQRVVEAHGGDENSVLQNRGLIEEFAEQQSLPLVEEVVEQSTDEAVHQYRDRLDIFLQNLIRDNIEMALESNFKKLIIDTSFLEAEQKFKCVQCDNDYTKHTNGPKACSFHAAEPDSFTQRYPCCDKPQPCQFGEHRSDYHCEYPYSNFFTYVRPVVGGYLYTTEEWALVKDTNLETEEVQRALISKLLRWDWPGDIVRENTFIVAIGIIAWHHPYYFKTFTAKDLQQTASDIRVSGETTIFRTSSDEDEYAFGEWMVSDTGNISGVRLGAKCATSSKPWVRECPIDFDTAMKSDNVRTISEGGFRSYTPASSYTLPEGTMIGPKLRDFQSRPVRRNFQTKSTLALPLILTAVSDPPLNANPTTARTDIDFFTGKLSVFNNAQESLKPITISSVSALYRLIGDTEYQPVTKCSVEGLDAPVTIQPNQAWVLNFEVQVPRSEEDANLGLRWWGRAHVARHRPIRIKIVIEDIRNEEYSLVLEYVHNPFTLSSRLGSDIGFLFFDDPRTYERYYVHIDIPDGDADIVVRILGNSIRVNTLEKLVYTCLKTQESEVELMSGNGTFNEWEWTIWALVDLSCLRVYAFKIILREGQKYPIKRFGCLGYVLCPEYGQISSEVREICDAQETAKLPPLEPYAFPDYPQDDDFDDIEPRSTPLLPETAVTLTEDEPRFSSVSDSTITDESKDLSEKEDVSIGTTLPVDSVPTELTTIKLVSIQEDNMLTSISPPTLLQKSTEAISDLQSIELHTRLASIDANLARVADTMNSLVVILSVLVVLAFIRLLF